MVTEPKQKAPRKVKRRRKPTEEIVDYIVEIETWDFLTAALALVHSTASPGARPSSAMTNGSAT
jgi:hypothetical protein